MNLLEIIRSRIDALPDGDHRAGLDAVYRHIEVAIRHHTRGRTEQDSSAFTDAVYRTNQAFEGSLKEAYRVLAGQSPDRKRPYDIETFIQSQNLLRSRVLDQFTAYRQEWRNPSAHDYILDFDEDEALLAIFSICGFAIVLIDQIAERLAFVAAQAAQTSQPSHQGGRAATDVVQAVIDFARTLPTQLRSTPVTRESEIEGLLAGFLSVRLPLFAQALDSRLRPDGPERPDILVTSDEAKLVIELKFYRDAQLRDIRPAIQQVFHYTTIAGITEAVVLIVSRDRQVSFSHEIHSIAGTTIHVITTSQHEVELNAGRNGS